MSKIEAGRVSPPVCRAGTAACDEVLLLTLGWDEGEPGDWLASDCWVAAPGPAEFIAAEVETPTESPSADVPAASALDDTESCDAALWAVDPSAADCSVAWPSVGCCSPELVCSSFVDGLAEISSPPPGGPPGGGPESTSAAGFVSVWLLGADVSALDDEDDPSAELDWLEDCPAVFEPDVDEEPAAVKPPGDACPNGVALGFALGDELDGLD